MSKLDQEIEAIIWEQRKRTIIIVLAIVIPIATLMYFGYTAKQGTSSEVVGTVVDMGSRSTESGQQAVLVVRLASGQEVQTDITDSSHYKKDQRVRLRKINPKYFGESSYQFLRYVE